MNLSAPPVVSDPIEFRTMLHERSALSNEEIAMLRKSLASDNVSTMRVEVEALLREHEQGSLHAGQIARAGVGAFMLGQPVLADRILASAKGDGAALFFHGMVRIALEDFEGADEKFLAAIKAGYDTIDCHLRRAGAIRRMGRTDEAEKILRQTGTEGARRAEYSYQMGCILSDRGDTYGAIEYFERAVDMDPHHAQALFRLAGENALYGNDQEAIRLYEQSLSRAPYHLGALLNLGLLYEDHGQYQAAAFCFGRILQFDPNHARAQMYMKDIEATQDMFFDDDLARNEARLEQLLAKPVTDFELSVRSRNCLASMNILTLRDLTTINEGDLLEGKNFGETSLIEIRELMQTHGLRIGQHLQAPKQKDASWAGPYTIFNADLSPQEQAQMARPVSDLQLSVRARKCMARLGITSLGELVQRTPDELLSTKNFGVTSLNEIRQQLAEMNMKLRND